MWPSQAEAKTRPPEKAVHKWQVFRAICTAKAPAGHLRPHARGPECACLSFHPETTLAPASDLVVFPSNHELTLRAHGMAPTTLRRHLAALVDGGLIIRRDSPNGKRYARKGQGGAIEMAFGFDLTPLVARADEFEALAEDVRAERALTRWCGSRSRSAARHRQDRSTGAEEGIPTRRSRQGPADGRRSIGSTHVRAASALRGARLEPVAEELSPLVAEILNLLESHIKPQKTNANESQTERHIQNSNPNHSIDLNRLPRKPGGEV